jgi:hypothetical protein
MTTYLLLNPKVTQLKVWSYWKTANVTTNTCTAINIDENHMISSMMKSAFANAPQSLEVSDTHLDEATEVSEIEAVKFPIGIYLNEFFLLPLSDSEDPRSKWRSVQLVSFEFDKTNPASSKVVLVGPKRERYETQVGKVLDKSGLHIDLKSFSLQVFDNRVVTGVSLIRMETSINAFTTFLKECPSEKQIIEYEIKWAKGLKIPSLHGIIEYFDNSGDRVKTTAAIVNSLGHHLNTDLITPTAHQTTITPAALFNHTQPINVAPDVSALSNLVLSMENNNESPRMSPTTPPLS